VYTLGALVALLAHLDRLGRLLGGSRRFRPTAILSVTAHPGKVRDPD
jgi:hypothetical protein